MKHFVMLGIAAALVVTQAVGQQPAIAQNGIRNAASYALPGLPNYGVAQGSIFVVFGTNLGPAKLVQASSFPLPTSNGLSGTSIKITVGGTTVDAIMLYTLTSQVAAAAPSNTPVGTGTFTVTYNGQTSAPAPITVVQSSFGIFTLNQAGSGAGVLQNFITAGNQPFNGPTTSAQPGQVITLWGTGVGPVSGNEAAGPLPGDLSHLDLHVFVGGKEAAVQYRGRSGCCAGVDQIVFTVPAGVQGCSVSVYVQIGGVASNFATMSVGSGGAECTDAGSLSASVLQSAMQNGGLRTGVVSVARFLSEGPTLTHRNDNLGGNFSKVSLSALQHSIAPSLGSCVVNQFPGYAPAGSSTGLDAGGVMAATPGGPYTLIAVPSYKGAYGLVFSPSTKGVVPGIVDDGTLMKPGTYTFNITGGADVGAATASIDFPMSFAWTNDAAITSIDRSQPLTINWSGGTAGAFVLIEVQSQSSQGVGAALLCYIDATLGTYTVPAAVMSALPASYTVSGHPQSSIYVGENFSGAGFAARGLDIGQTSFVDAVDKGPVAVK